MGTASKDSSSKETQIDPGVSNDTRSSGGGYDAHAWHSLNQIFERLGTMNQKIDQLGIDQGKLKETIEKHEKVVARVGFTIAGAALVVTALWFIYTNFIEGQYTLTPTPDPAVEQSQEAR